MESKESFREDGISTTFLKSVKYEFLKPLTTLINQMILTSNFPDSFIIADQKTTDPCTIANGFNTFFANIGSDINSKVRSQQHFTNFLTNPLPQHFNFTRVSETVVLKSLSNLKSKASFGEDGLSTKFLKSVKHEIPKPLTTLINQIISTSTFPDKLKIAKVVPLYKKDDPLY